MPCKHTLLLPGPTGRLLKPEPFTYEVRPCTEDAHGVTECEPEDAMYWGVYARPLTPDAHGHYIAEHRADFIHEHNARAYARLLAKAVG